jgi:hypothetical protein
MKALLKRAAMDLVSGVPSLCGYLFVVRPGTARPANRRLFQWTVREEPRSDQEIPEQGSNLHHFTEPGCDPLQVFTD